MAKLIFLHETLCDLCMLVLGVTDAARVELGYKAGPWNAVSCSSTHLFVREDDSPFVHIHAWDGAHIHRVELPRGPDRHVIHAIQYINQGRLVAAMGPDPLTVTAVSALVTAQVQYHSTLRQSTAHTQCAHRYVAARYA
jgi:hypothetical protein